MVIFILMLGLLGVTVVLLYHKRKKKYMYATGRSVMTFSNPNYYTSNPEVPPQPPQQTDKKSFLWKRLKYDKSQVIFYLSVNNIYDVIDKIQYKFHKIQHFKLFCQRFTDSYPVFDVLFQCYNVHMDILFKWKFYGFLAGIFFTKK